MIATDAAHDSRRPLPAPDRLRDRRLHRAGLPAHADGRRRRRAWASPRARSTSTSRARRRSSICVLRHADRAGPDRAAGDASRPTPQPGATLATVQQRLARGGALPAARLRRSSRARVADVRAELEAILRELYDALARNRTAIKLIDRCAHDYPELAKLWYRRGPRGRARRSSTRYLERPRAPRTAPPLRRHAPSPRASSSRRSSSGPCTVTGTRRRRPSTRATAEDTVVQFIVGALAEGVRP